MAQTSEFNVIYGNEIEINQKLSQRSAQGWRPILMTTVTTDRGTVMILVMLGHVRGA